MERIERHEGETLELGGYTFGVAYCRNKRVVLLVNSAMGETSQDVETALRRFQAKLDVRQPKESNTG